jgi:WG containing repeat
MKKKIGISILVVVFTVFIFLLVIIKEGTHLYATQMGDDYFIQFSANDLNGIINIQTEEVFVEPTYERINCNKGGCTVYKDGKQGIIDYEGDVLLNRKYDFLNCVFSKRDFCFAIKNQKSYLINYKGEKMADLSFISFDDHIKRPDYYLDFFTEDYLFFKKTTLINQEYITYLVISDYEGNLLFEEPIKYYSEYDHERNLIILYSEKRKTHGFVNMNNQLMVDPKYEDFTVLDNGLIIAQYFGFYGVINDQNEVIIDFKYDELLYNEGVFSAKLGFYHYGLLNEEGEMLKEFKDIPTHFMFNEGLSRIKIEEKWGFVNQEGEIVVEPQYDEAFHFSEGLAAVKKDGKFGFINTNGEVVIDYQYGQVDSFKEGVAYTITINNDEVEEGFINQENEKLTLIHNSSSDIPYQYENQFKTYNQRDSKFDLYLYFVNQDHTIYYRSVHENYGYQLEFNNEDNDIMAVLNPDGKRVINQKVYTIDFYKENLFCVNDTKKSCYNREGEIIGEFKYHDRLLAYGSIVIKGNYYGTDAADIYDHNLNLIYHKSKGEQILIYDDIQKMLITDKDRIYLFDLVTKEKVEVYHLSFLERIKIKLRDIF